MQLPSIKQEVGFMMVTWTETCITSMQIATFLPQDQIGVPLRQQKIPGVHKYAHFEVFAILISIN